VDQLVSYYRRLLVHQPNSAPVFN